MPTTRSVRRMTSTTARIIAGAAGSIVLVAALTAAATPSAHPPSATNYAGTLNGVTAISGSNAWAVGEGLSAALLVLRWNGRSWTKVPAPSPGTLLNYLNGVSAVSAADVWAVGAYQDSRVAKTLTLRWNGTRWTRVPSPSFGGTGTSGSRLASVSATSATDAWAVGSYAKPGAGPMSQALILHWNGRTWTKVPAPSPGTLSNSLLGVTSVSASDAWAVGSYLVGSVAKAQVKPLLLHWNGASWAQVAVPLPPKVNGSGLVSVSADSPTDVWAVGEYNVVVGGKPTPARPLALHWNGASWARVATPTPPAGTGALAAVTAVSTRNAWAVGMGGPADRNTLVLRWDGKSWTQVASPSPGSSGSNLSAVSAAGPGTTWTVGSFQFTSKPGGISTLVLRCHRAKCTRS
jgi:hypothetical protein